jgi:hypothetical protein
LLAFQLPVDGGEVEVIVFEVVLPVELNRDDRVELSLVFGFDLDL